MKKLLSSILILLASMCMQARPVLGFDGEEYATVGIYIKDLSTGQVVADCNSSRTMTPASTMKALTTATAMSILGESYRFETPVELRGSRQGQIWNGDLVVCGSADPTLESEFFESNLGFCDSIVSHLKKMGITRIAGTVQVTESLKDGGPVPQWEIEDVAWSYGAALFGLNWRDNIFRLWPATGRTKPHVPDLKVELRKDPDGTELLRGVASDRLIVWGRNLTNKKWCLTATMPSPAVVLAYELTARLQSAGIQVGKKNLKLDSKVASTTLYTHRSPVSSEIFRSLMVRSDNMMAEGMLRAIAPSGTRKEAIKKEKELWSSRGLNLDYAGIIDGSGLARGNRISPGQLGDMLEFMSKTEYGRAYVACFPRAGLHGTMKSFMAKTPLEGKLALKTGSVNAVQCFAGYMLDGEDNPTHVVVVMVNAFYCSRARLRDAISSYLQKQFVVEEYDKEGK